MIDSMGGIGMFCFAGEVCILFSTFVGLRNFVNRHGRYVCPFFFFGS